MDWRDIKWFHEVVEHGSFSAAARGMGTTQATISRRIKALEDELGVDLFRRGHAGSVLTPSGERLAASARAMNQAFEQFVAQHRSMRAERRTVVITCGALIGMYLSQNLGPLQLGAGDVDIEVKTTNAFLDLDKGEADIALRNQRPTKGQLTAKKLVAPNYGPFAVFGSKQFYTAGTFTTVEQLKAEPWAGYAAKFGNVPTARWLREHIGDDRLKFRLNNSPMILQVARTNRALAALPRFIGAGDEALVEVFGPIAELNFELFIVRRESDIDPQLLAVIANIERLFA